MSPEVEEVRPGVPLMVEAIEVLKSYFCVFTTKAE